MINTKKFEEKLHQAYDEWDALNDIGWKLLDKRAKLQRQKCKDADEEYERDCKLEAIEQDIRDHFIERAVASTKIDCYTEVLDELKGEQDEQVDKI